MSRVHNELLQKYNKLIDTVRELRQENQCLTKEIYRLQALNKAYAGAIASIEEELGYYQFLINYKENE